MRILYVGKEQTGCWYVRQHIVMEELRKLGHTCDEISGNGESIAIDDYDLFIFSRLYSEDVKDIVDELKRRGKKILYELDDAMDLIPEFNVHYPKAAKYLPSLPYLLGQANAVTVTTDKLREHYKQLTYAPVYALPNCVRLQDYPFPHGRENKKPSDPIRIGFAGSTTHVADLPFAMQVVRELQDISTRKVKLVLFGIGTMAKTFEDWLVELRPFLKKVNNETMTKQFDRFVKEMTLHDDFEWVQPVPVNEYHKKLCDLNLDIGLCPLDETPFNQYKSNIKALEYTMSGAVAVASAAYPHLEFPSITLKNNHGMWMAQLKQLVEDDDYRLSTLNKDIAWILKNRDIENEIRRYETVYKSLT